MSSEHGEPDPNAQPEVSEGVVGIFLAIALIVLVFAFMIALVG